MTLIVSDEKVTTFAESLAAVMDMEMNMLMKNYNTDFASLETDSGLH